MVVATSLYRSVNQTFRDDAFGNGGFIQSVDFSESLDFEQIILVSVGKS